MTFIGDAEAICRANIFLRTTERVLLKVGSFHAETFEDLFQGTRAIPWEEYLPKDAKFWVAKASSIKSKLFSPSDIQSIMKKSHGGADEKRRTGLSGSRKTARASRSAFSFTRTR